MTSPAELADDLEVIFTIGATPSGQLSDAERDHYWSFWGERDPLERDHIAPAIIDWLRARSA